MDLIKDFRKFAIDKTKVRATVLDDQLSKPNSFLTPYILEERQLNVTQMDILVDFYTTESYISLAR